MLTKQGCGLRQERLVQWLSSNDVDAAYITDARDVYYFSGDLQSAWPICLMIAVDGRSWLATYAEESSALADEIITYPSQEYYTNNADNQMRLTAVVEKHLAAAGRTHNTMAYQAESMPAILANTIQRETSATKVVMLDKVLESMQKRKDADEIALIRRSIRADLAAYRAAQATITPGVNELDVLAAAQRAAMLDAGEMVSHNGDYHSGALGGSAQDRRIEAGELFTVDAWTIYQGYWSDLSRTYIVGNQPTDLQVSIHQHIAKLQDQVARILKPGLHGNELWRMMDAVIREHPALADSGLFHHAGHGVGLRAHEAPDLNKDRDGILAIGDVVSVEPGGYTDAARCGVRIENMYLITESGAENLSEFPMNLQPAGTR
jgi:Xaa-Pro dipeptidase